MQSKMKIFLCVFIILIGIPSGLCIKCWDCRSDLDPKCGDPFDNSTIPITDCKVAKGITNLPIPSMCRKISQKVNGQWQYIRGCAQLDVGSEPKEKCFKKKELNNVDAEYCLCDNKDGCNSSSVVAPLPLLFVSLSALFFALRKVFVL